MQAAGATRQRSGTFVISNVPPKLNFILYDPEFTSNWTPGPTGNPPLKFITAVAVLLLCFTSQDATAQVPQVQPAGVVSSESIVLKPGDIIRIEVWRNKDMSGDFTISPDGYIIHPLYRELKVAGLPLNAVETQMRAFLARYESNPTFVLSPLLRIVVGGEVRQPSIYTVPPGTTVAQAIALAGGPTDRGRLDKITLVSQGSAQTLDVTRPDASATSAQVHSGDEILVARRRNVMQDVIAPSSSILAALAAVTGVVIQVSRHP